MLLPLYQQSEVFAASRLTSFGDGPFLLSINNIAATSLRILYDFPTSSEGRLPDIV